MVSPAALGSKRVERGFSIRGRRLEVEQEVEMNETEENTFDDVDTLLRRIYAILQEEDGDSELISQIEGALSLCVLRRECSEINEAEL